MYNAQHGLHMQCMWMYKDSKSVMVSTNCGLNQMLRQPSEQRTLVLLGNLNELCLQDWSMSVEYISLKIGGLGL